MKTKSELDSLEGNPFSRHITEPDLGKLLKLEQRVLDWIYPLADSRKPDMDFLLLGMKQREGDTITNFNYTRDTIEAALFRWSGMFEAQKSPVLFFYETPTKRIDKLFTPRMSPKELQLALSVVLKLVVTRDIAKIHASLEELSSQQDNDKIINAILDTTANLCNVIESSIKTSQTYNGKWDYSSLRQSLHLVSHINSIQLPEKIDKNDSLVKKRLDLYKNAINAMKIFFVPYGRYLADITYLQSLSRLFDRWSRTQSSKKPINRCGHYYRQSCLEDNDLLSATEPVLEKIQKQSPDIYEKAVLLGKTLYELGSLELYMSNINNGLKPRNTYIPDTQLIMKLPGLKEVLYGTKKTRTMILTENTTQEIDHVSH